MVVLLRVLCLIPVVMTLYALILRPWNISFPGVTDGDVLLLTAHPDDECMFFAPTVLNLVKSGRKVWVLCLSVGNAEGLGEVRKEELKAACRVLGITDDRVEALDRPDLPDSMALQWSPTTILEIVNTFLGSHEISLILTFDDRGVSSHPNHISIPVALATQNALPPVYILHSSSLLPKYTGALSLLLPQLTHTQTSSHPRFTSNFSGYRQSIDAMLAHKSQMVWFRWLYILFSKYMWVNEWWGLEVSSPYFNDISD